MADRDVQREFIEAESKREPGARLTRTRASDMAVVVGRLDTITEWMASGAMPDQAAARARKPPPEGLGMSRWQANRYVGVALARLQKNDQLEPLESKRARIKAMVYENIAAAKANVRTWVTEGGEVSQPAPDYRAINGALALLAEIEGVKGG